uniref:Uncharacterized protein n=1 Tax=Halimeda minima TaxID=170427 RepID=A0A386AYY7_9CHLO|nr:hypothetical protein [Halimeda minima]
MKEGAPTSNSESFGDGGLYWSHNSRSSLREPQLSNKLRFSFKSIYKSEFSYCAGSRTSCSPPEGGRGASGGVSQIGKTVAVFGLNFYLRQLLLYGFVLQGSLRELPSPARSDWLELARLNWQPRLFRPVPLSQFNSMVSCIAGRFCLIIIIGVRNEAALKNYSLPFACMLYFLRVYQLAFTGSRRERICQRHQTFYLSINARKKS